MPPEQCPECGRFLAKAFVAGLASGPAPCPKCATELTGAQFGLGDAAPPPAPPAATAAATPAAGSAGDPLAGWDAPGADVVDLDAVRGHQPPPDGAILLGAGVAGAVIGAALTRRSLRGTALGAVLGAAAAGAARQVWRLDD